MAGYGRGGAGNYAAAAAAATAAGAPQRRLPQSANTLSDDLAAKQSHEPAQKYAQTGETPVQQRLPNSQAGPDPTPSPTDSPSSPMSSPMSSSSSSSLPESSLSTTTMNSELETASLDTYKLTGRGGAGNYWMEAYYDSAARRSRSKSAEIESLNPWRGHVRRFSEIFQFRGRGGAGNFERRGSNNSNNSNNSNGLTQDDLERSEPGEVEVISQRAIGDVEMGLARPQRVFLGGGRERAGDVDIGIIGIERLAVAIDGDGES